MLRYIACSVLCHAAVIAPLAAYSVANRTHSPKPAPVEMELVAFGQSDAPREGDVRLQNADAQPVEKSVPHRAAPKKVVALINPTQSAREPAEVLEHDIEAPASDAPMVAPAALPASVRGQGSTLASPGSLGGAARGGLVPAGAGVKTGSKDSVYTYLTHISQMLRKNQQYPYAARARRLSGAVVLRINVDASGAVTAVKVLRSSGHDVLDRAALESVTRLGRFPVPPAGVDLVSHPVDVPVVYTLT